MEIKMTKNLAEAIGIDKLKSFKIDRSSFYARSHTPINLRPLKLDQLDTLENLIKPFADRASEEKVRGAATAMYDISNWRKLTANPTEQRARNVSHFSSLLTEYFRTTAGHRAYHQENGWWYSYFVDRIIYHPPQKTRGYGKIPAYCEMHVAYKDFGILRTTSWSFYAREVVGRDLEQVLAAANIMAETPALRQTYLAEEARWNAEAGDVGCQHLAEGEGVSERGDHWSSYSRSIRLDKDGAPARVVVDIPTEGDRDRDASIDENFWEDSVVGKPELDEESEETPDAEIEPQEIEIPIHPELVIFELTRQMRLTVHINQLTKYIYSPKLGEKLILPGEARHLIDLLLAGTGGFQDIIGGKSGGSIIACTGIPGTGKTLTSEVYAEVAERPLYSVQCSQLGTSPDELEKELLKVFARAARWNAILLLDEADVYVAKRGSDLTQNAIVGVFLRVLEYYKGVLFMTTNRADLIDDAVLSRCIARIDYATPDIGDQKKIWRVLADTAKIAMSDDDIEAITTEFSKLTGRDIKNLLKLGSMVQAADKSFPAWVDVIRFVKQFKPTLG